MNKVQLFTQTDLKQNIPPLRAGDTVRVHERIKEKDGERIQIFEGVVIARKHGKGPSATFTVRKISVHNVGVEKIFPLHSPTIQKIEVVRHVKVRRAKLYYLRDLKKRRKKPSKMLGLVYEEVIEEPQAGQESAPEEVAEEKQEETPKEEKAQ